MTSLDPGALAAPATDPEGPFARGLVIDDQYEVRGLLAAGGMSHVYAAFDRRLQRNVAIKAAADQLGDHLIREARVLAGFRHPNLVAVHALGWHDEVPYIVLEYLSGPSLAQVLAERQSGALEPHSAEEALRLVVQLADALAPLHARGLVHCDLKPGNIIATPERLVLIDLGLARDREAPVQACRFSGSPPFLAPEAIEGRVAPADLHQLDIYALGMILYAMLAGATPFGDDDPQEVMRRQISEDAPPLASRRDDLPPGLSNFVATILSREIAQRPRDLATLREALHGFPVLRRSAHRP